jgi:hypothetical protein
MYKHKVNISCLKRFYLQTAYSGITSTSSTGEDALSTGEDSLFTGEDSLSTEEDALSTGGDALFDDEDLCMMNTQN